MMGVEDPTSLDRLAGTLLGTALGDALGLPAEGMSARAISRRFGRVDRFRLLGRTGYVSDDTEQAALVAEALIGHPDDPEECARDFRRRLVAWFARLPFGVGRATVRACLRAVIGLDPSGVASAGNGAAMRAAVIGVFFVEDPDRRDAFGRAIAEVTHRDPRAVAGALFVADLAAEAARSGPAVDWRAGVEASIDRVAEPGLGEALRKAAALHDQRLEPADAARAIGTSGYVLHSVPLAAYFALRAGDDPLEALAETIAVGGDTDSTAAMLGGWLGARHGASGLPADLIGRLHDGPFGPTHLRALAAGLTDRRAGRAVDPPAYRASAALARNLGLWPVVLAHGFRRWTPFT